MDHDAHALNSPSPSVCVSQPAPVLNKMPGVVVAQDADLESRDDTFIQHRNGSHRARLLDLAVVTHIVTCIGFSGSPSVSDSSSLGAYRQGSSCTR